MAAGTLHRTDAEHTLALPGSGVVVHVWIDQDSCTGAGLCVDRCPELFVVLEDGLGYVYDDGAAISELGRAHPVPDRLEQAAVDAAENCPGECIHLEVAPSPSTGAGETGDIADAEIVIDGP